MNRMLIGLVLCVVAVAGGCSGDGIIVVVPPAGNFILIAFDNAGDLFTLNETTAAESFRLNTFYTPPGMPAMDLGRVSASIYVPARGEVWIGGGGSGGTSSCSACIMLLNMVTGEATLLFDNSAINGAIPDLALRLSDGAIFTTEADGSGFRSIDNVTGEATSISSTTGSGRGNGLTFADPAETLYLAEAGNGILCTVDPASGADAFIANLTYTGSAGANPGIVAMTTRPTDGVVFVLVKDGAGGGGTKDTFLGTLNLATGEVTIISMTTTKMEGLAFVPASIVP